VLASAVVPGQLFSRSVAGAQIFWFHFDSSPWELRELDASALLAERDVEFPSSTRHFEIVQHFQHSNRQS
jgi:hypothetical protein